MRIRFWGAAGEVTGSCYEVECGERRFLVDCGVHQGANEDERNREPFPFPVEGLDAVFLTHAHMDHSGRIPYLVRKGFAGPVWTTPATARLVEILWNDSVRLMKEEAEWRTRKAVRRGLPPVVPLYDEKDVDKALKLLRPTDWDTETAAADGVSFSLHDAGHILGSSSIAFKLSEGDRATRLVFSGDLGQQFPAVDRAPSAIREADYVLIESTYGDRLHKDDAATREEFRSVILTALKDRGKVLIPSFVVDRAQRLLFELSLMQIEGLLPEIPIFFDSPMGVRATELYRMYGDTLSGEVRRHAAAGVDLFSPRGFKNVSTPEESQKINDVPFGIVIAGSGMCTGGRIVHHLKHGAWNPRNHIVFVGYQAYGTLGRRIVDGETELRIAGEDVIVKAQVHTIGGFSAHGDRDDLLAWAGHYTTNPLFFVTHGEPKASQAFSAALRERGMRGIVPALGQEFSIEPGASAATMEAEAKPAAAARTPQAEIPGVLDDIERLLERLRRDEGALADTEESKRLLLSARTSLESALRGKTAP